LLVATLATATTLFSAMQEVVQAVYLTPFIVGATIYDGTISVHGKSLEQLVILKDRIKY